MTESKMSLRARAYLGITAAFHLTLGSFCLLVPETFLSSSYEGLRHALPVPAGLALVSWGALFALVGTICAFAAVFGREPVARVALMMSVIVTGAVAGSFLASWMSGTLQGPTGPLIWLTLAFKDMTMLRNPMRNPFEPVVQRVLANHDGG